MTARLRYASVMTYKENQEYEIHSARRGRYARCLVVVGSKDRRLVPPLYERYSNLGAARSIRMTYSPDYHCCTRTSRAMHQIDTISLKYPSARHAITDSPALTRPFQRATSSVSIDGCAPFKGNDVFTLLIKRHYCAERTACILRLKLSAPTRGWGPFKHAKSGSFWTYYLIGLLGKRVD